MRSAPLRTVARDKRVSKTSLFSKLFLTSVSSGALSAYCLSRADIRAGMHSIICGCPFISGNFANTLKTAHASWLNSPRSTFISSCIFKSTPSAISLERLKYHFGSFYPGICNLSLLHIVGEMLRQHFEWIGSVRLERGVCHLGLAINRDAYTEQGLLHENAHWREL